MQTVCIVTKNTILADAIALQLTSSPVAVCKWQGDGNMPQKDTYIWDLDSMDLPKDIEGKVVCMAWNTEKPADFPYLWIDRPFRPARLRAVLGLYDVSQQDYAPYLHHDKQAVLYGGEEIALTPVEFKLFTYLFERKNTYIPREELHQAVWAGVGDAGVVNVYMHYLRQKFEKNGHKLFHVARGRGYAYLEKEGK